MATDFGLFRPSSGYGCNVYWPDDGSKRLKHAAIVWYNKARVVCDGKQ
jgi:hypothetical protein